MVLTFHGESKIRRMANDQKKWPLSFYHSLIPHFLLGINILHMALGVVGGILVLFILIVISFFIVCRMKGLTLQKKQVSFFSTAKSVKRRMNFFPEHL